MPKYKRKRKYSKKTSTKRRKTKTKSLTKRVAKVERVQRLRTERLTYLGHPTDAVMSANYVWTDVFVPMATTGSSSVMSQIFAGQAEPAKTKSATLKRIDIMGKIYPYTEPSEVDITLCLLTPKNQKIRAVTIDDDGSLTLTEGHDYTFNQGIVYINQLRWKIHYIKRFWTRSNVTGTLATTEGWAHTTNFRMHLRPNWKMANTMGAWSSIPQEHRPYYQRLFMVCFNNNSPNDLQSPSIKFSSKFEITQNGT